MGSYLKFFLLIFVFFAAVASADERVLTSFVEDAAVDVYGRMYVLKYVKDSGKNKLLVSRYLTNGKLDEGYQNKGHLLIELPAARGSAIVNAKIALCPKTGDMIIGAGRTFPAETQPLDERSGVAAVREFFQRQAVAGDNRLFLMRFSDKGELRKDFGKNGYRVTRISADNSDRFYSLGVAEDGRILMSWRQFENSKIFVANAEGKITSKREAPTEGMDSFTTNLGLTKSGAFRAAGIVIDTEGETDATRPAYYQGGKVRVVDRIFEEDGNRRGLSSSLLINQGAKGMAIVVPGADNDVVETIELKTGNGKTQQQVALPGILVHDILRPTQTGNMMTLTVQVRGTALVATEINPKDGKVLRTREIGVLFPKSDPLNPNCMDILSDL